MPKLVVENPVLPNQESLTIRGHGFPTVLGGFSADYQEGRGQTTVAA